MSKKVAKKWIKNKSDEQAVKEGCYFDEQSAERICTFIETFCSHSKGEFAHQPFKLLDWERYGIIYPIYGWKRPDHRRRIRRAYLSVAKKNGKSTLLSALSAYHLLADGEQGAEVYSAAVDRDQASIIHAELKNMLEASPDLASRVDTTAASKKIIVVPATRSVYKALSAEIGSKEGQSASFTCIDELHRQKKEDLFHTLRYAGSARRQPLFVTITTAGVDRESICYKQYCYAKEWLKSERIDTQFFGYVAEADPDDDIDDPKTWRKANPSLGITINEEDFRNELGEAKASNSALSAFKRYRLNIWTDSLTCWIPQSAWDAVRLDPEPNLIGQPCWCGLDGASIEDTFSIVLLFRLEDGSFFVKPFIWIPEATVALREQTDNLPLSEWNKGGHLRFTEGSRADYDLIRKEINEIGQRYHIQQIAADPLNVTQLMGQLQSDGFDVGFYRQSMGTMNEPTKEFERLIHSKGLFHDGNLCMRQHVANATLEEDSFENIRPVKPQRNKRCDSVIATIQALRLAMMANGDRSDSIQEIVWV